MSDERIPKYVSLPDVPNYTDRVEFSGLVLPAGYDEERLLVNIGSFKRVQASGGLGQISISSFKAETPDGIATDAEAEYQPLSRGGVSFPTKSKILDHPNATIEIDHSQLGEATTPYARTLNNAVRTGLEQAARSANIDKDKFKGSVRCYGFFMATGISQGTFDLGEASLHTLYLSPIAPLLQGVMLMREGIHQEMPVRETLSRWRKSYFVGCSPDRYLAAAAIIGGSKFIRAAK